MVSCPVCTKSVKEININSHLDSGCTSFVESSQSIQQNGAGSALNFFKTPAKKSLPTTTNTIAQDSPIPSFNGHGEAAGFFNTPVPVGNKRPLESGSVETPKEDLEAFTKRVKASPLMKVAPLAERMRPRTLDDVYGQELVGPKGVLRGLIENNRVPSLILWGGPGTGKTTIARVVAHMVGSRFVEINSTSSGVAECKRIFAEARNELGLTGRKTILFCDEIHRFSKSQQDVFLGPVEAGQVTLIGATTENPSFKVQNALLSRCRTFTLAKLSDEDVFSILVHALEVEGPNYNPDFSIVTPDLLFYLSSFADGDARTALNLLELAMDLSTRPDMTISTLKSSLTKTLVYDRAGDQHYDTISALHKSIRGSDPDAALYYLARMLQSGEDALYIARRLVVVASEDVGLADNSLLSLATAAYTAAEKIGMPEARIPLAHATVALALAPKSTRAYRGLENAEHALNEPGIAGLPIPIHLRNAPTRLMKEMGYGAAYKYNPSFEDGRCMQEYLPEKMRGRRFLEDRDLGTEVDPDLESEKGSG
ncbi:hypothetical protein MMC10_006091 [Thelotrema lepadinum]|nr:hypothetical protein [Thelotrema lepadinum]